MSYTNAAFELAMGMIEAGIKALYALKEKGALPPRDSDESPRISEARSELEFLDDRP